MKTFTRLVPLVPFIFLASMTAYFIYEDIKHPIVCVNSAIVKSIVSINGRSATILLDTGATVVVNQATLAPGSTFCTKYERK